MTIKEKCTSPAKLQTEILYQDDYVIVGYDSEASYLNLEWLKHPDSTAFRNGFSKAVELAIELGCQNWLSDARAILYMEFADQNWLIENILPLIPKTRVRKFARIVSQPSLPLMDDSRIYSMLDKLNAVSCGIYLELFTSKELALQWLYPEGCFVKKAKL